MDVIKKQRRQKGHEKFTQGIKAIENKLFQSEIYGKCPEKACGRRKREKEKLKRYSGRRKENKTAGKACVKRRMEMLKKFEKEMNEIIKLALKEDIGAGISRPMLISQSAETRLFLWPKTTDNMRLPVAKRVFRCLIRI